jgi:hypothetical protein
MKAITTSAFLIFSTFFFVQNTNAQVYSTAIGARLGYPLSASIKAFITDESAVEGYVGFRHWPDYRWVSINGAYQIHFPIEELPELQWYLGAGGGIYFWNYRVIGRERDTQVGIGVQAYLGLDYTFEDVPLNLTIDWVPTVFLSGYRTGFGATYGNIGVRYVLSR